ncbi:MAG: NAD(P)/FAD-dependent oxidoreductase [Clostridia bacterium]
MGKKIIIIGAGLAGLSSGIHLQQKGYSTEIFELASSAGGQCTAWTRKGYRFDGCIHWMVGTKSDNEIYKLYRNVDALVEDTTIYNSPSLLIELNGIMYNVPLEITKFRSFLHKLAPEDKDSIDKFCNDIKIMVDTKMVMGPPETLAGMLSFLKNSTGFIKLASKYSKKSISDILFVFKNENLKKIIISIMPANFSALALFMMLGNRMGNNAGYPIGGASDLIKRMEEKYYTLGGKITYNSKVDKIIVENGIATSIETNDKLYEASGIVAACDAYDTLYNMLDNKYKHPQLNKMLHNAELFNPLILVSFGLDKKFNIPYSTAYEYQSGIEVAPNKFTYGFNLRAFDFDFTAAPENCSSAMVLLEAPLDYWVNLRAENYTDYEKQKEIIANTIKNIIDERIPGFSNSIKVVDVATPATYIRYTNIYKGSWEGFLPTPKALMTKIKRTIPKVKNLFVCGQWTTPGGGICTAVNDGKVIAKMISKSIK